MDTPMAMLGLDALSKVLIGPQLPTHFVQQAFINAIQGLAGEPGIMACSYKADSELVSLIYSARQSKKKASSARFSSA